MNSSAFENWQNAQKRFMVKTVNKFEMCDDTNYFIMRYNIVLLWGRPAVECEKVSCYRETPLLSMRHTEEPVLSYVQQSLL